MKDCWSFVRMHWVLPASHCARSGPAANSWPNQCHRAAMEAPPPSLLLPYGQARRGYGVHIRATRRPEMNAKP